MAVLEGNLTADPVVTPVKEWSVIKFSVACNEGIKQLDGNFKDKAHFFNCEYWTKKPQFWISQMTKGKGIVCQCEPIQDRWEDEKGQHSVVKFKLTSYPVIKSSAHKATEGNQQQQYPGDSGQKFEDDMPF
jgi:single stranded DNA-binding protein